MNKKKTIFLTGATGHMGFEALKLLAADDRFLLKLLILPDKASRKIVNPYMYFLNVEIIEGDLRNINDIRKGVKNADFVLHVGALIPPVADKYPELAEAINYGGTLNVIKAIKEQDDPDSIKLVYIATVASMGDRKPPIHWGRTGDPIKVSSFDAYGVSKVKAERAVIESGLKNWVSLRQSGMLHKEYLKMMHPIMFHQPLNNCIEWSTAEDSGQALYNICVMDLPDRFWRSIYNIGSGPEFRETYYEFLTNVFGIMGVKNIHKIVKPNDFATRNFHCVWYSDSDKLEKLLHFRKSTYKGFWDSVQKPFYIRLVRFVPSWIMRKFVLEPLSKKSEGTRHWIKKNITDKIKAFWGSRANWERIPAKWKNFILKKSPPAREIFHGYNEERSFTDIGIKDCLDAAVFRGGKCLSTGMNPGEMYLPLEWSCAFGHKFSASPNTVLKGGHWCPLCDTDSANYINQAEKSDFFAQVYDIDSKAL